MSEHLSRARWRPRLEPLLAWFRLPAGDLLRDAVYRRLWTSILISSFGGQITLLALPLTAAVLLDASPTQMGLLTAAEIAPFVLLSLPAGVWLDRVRKLPVYVAGEAAIALALLTVPLAWWAGWLSMGWMYTVGFIIGAVYVTAGSAAQIVLTQVVPRERLVEAHAKNALATSGAEVAGPGVAGALIKLVGAPLALVADAVLLAVSVLILKGVKVQEKRAPRQDARFWADLKAGLHFVREQRLLVSLAVMVGSWQLFHHAAAVVQILFATRELHLNEQQIGLSYMVMGVGTITASTFGHRISRRIGPGPCLTLGVAITGVGWGLLALAPANAWGVAAFSAMLLCFSAGAVFIFINFLSLRQAVTPEPLLGRMTSTMRWLILLPAGPGALLGGWLGEHVSLRASLAVASGGALLLALVALRWPAIRQVRELPQPVRLEEEPALGAEADVGPARA
jgi:MFS family permease